MGRLIMDIESRSHADLKKVGVYNYAVHPTTSITHVGYKLDDAPVHVWRPLTEGLMPCELLEALINQAITLVAHNVQFEYVMLTGPPGRAISMPIEALKDLSRWNCTAARAAQVGLPRELSRLSIALDLRVKKDAEGHRLMMQMCKPRRGGGWWEDESRMARMSNYCANDVEVEYLISHMLPELTLTEQALWCATQCANDRGVMTDRALLYQLDKLSKQALAALNAKIKELTNGEVPKVSNHGALTRYLNSNGVETDGCDKHIVADLLEDEELDETVHKVLELRAEGGGSAVAKIPAIIRRLSADDRLRGTLVYGGAPATNRWSSNGAQLQNLPRHDKRFNVPAILRDLACDPSLSELEDIHGPPVKVCAELIRPVFTAAPGHSLVRGDYSQIEARVLAWFAGEEHRLMAFRAGRDIYKVAASGLYHVPEAQIGDDDDRRQEGKTCELACGYQGGLRALQKMALNFNRKLTKAKAEALRDGWRAANPRIVEFWYAIEQAAFLCVATKHDQRLGNIIFSLRRNTLTMQLPSGRRLVYWHPVIKEAETPWGELRRQVHCTGEDSFTHKWSEFKLYGGHLTENLCQATARDIMAEAWLRLVAESYDVILSVHDELLVEEAHKRFPDPEEAVRAVKTILERVPDWAEGLPITAEVKAGERYMK